MGCDELKDGRGRWELFASLPWQPTIQSASNSSLLPASASSVQRRINHRELNTPANRWADRSLRKPTPLLWRRPSAAVRPLPLRLRRLPAITCSTPPLFFSLPALSFSIAVNSTGVAKCVKLSFRLWTWTVNINIYYYAYNKRRKNSKSCWSAQS